MFTFLFYVLGFLVVLWVLEKIPGFHYLAAPILESIVKSLHFMVVHSGLWILWIFRMFVRSHKTFLRHLITPRSSLNQSEVARKMRKSI